MDINDLVLTFPTLPLVRDDHGAWSPHVAAARQRLSNCYTRALSVLRQEADPIRLAYHVEIIADDALPILEALEQNSATEHIPSAWLEVAALALGNLVVHLRTAIEGVEEREHTNIAHVEPVTVIRTGRPGRPRKLVDKSYLAEALSPYRNISITKLASVLKVHRHTLRQYATIHGVTRKFSTITDHDLDTVVRAYRQQHPHSGVRYLTGFMRRFGVRVQKVRLTRSVERVDGIGRVLRERNTIKRRKYTSSRPNALWHLDGHHKLIHWSIVIHGFVDGYCRTVTGIRASNNNRSSTVLDVFEEAIGVYGLPSRLRGDRGGENVEASVYMILRRGPNRASFMWGSSTHNTRIERMWVEVGRQFGRSWRAFFTRLGRLHRLDRKDPQHLWLLHTLFLQDINTDCKAFQEEWNAHPISGPDTHDQSPNDLRLLGQTENGLYTDEYDDVHPEILQQHYGVYGRVRHRHSGQTGAGHASDSEDDSDSDSESGIDHLDLEGRITADQAHHIRHEAIETAEVLNPFTSPAIHELFMTALAAVQLQGHIPSGFGLLEGEWEGGEYPSYENIKSGQKGSKELTIGLPDHIWRPRAEKWGQALDIMLRLQYIDDENSE